MSNDSGVFTWQLYRTQSNFSNRGSRVPAFFGLSRLADGVEIDVDVFTHGSDWSPDDYTRVVSEQVQKVLQDNSNPTQQLQQFLSTDTLAAACRSSCHQVGEECSCFSLGPFTARLSSRKSGQQHDLVGIQHDGTLAPYRPDKPNHDLLLMVQVRCVLVGLHPCLLACCC
jgi:hypothetical protein